jgi:hypothetical protein
MYRAEVARLAVMVLLGCPLELARRKLPRQSPAAAFAEGQKETIDCHQS